MKTKIEFEVRMYIDNEYRGSSTFAYFSPAVRYAKKVQSENPDTNYSYKIVKITKEDFTPFQPKNY